ncbi:MAG: VWA domain-containing protein, partial [Polyangiaceae bacterium]
MAKHPRNVTFLLDTSGSMGGAPIEQAKRVTLAMLDGLGNEDTFELIEFSHSPRRWKKGLTRATSQDKAAAGAWLRSLTASGGTEMREGILEALKPVAHRKGRAISQQVVLVTDGLIGFEQEIVESILSLLPGGARLHTVGIGSSVNRSLTGPAARAGRGIEVILGLSGDPERAAERLRKHSDAPLVVEIEASGSALLLTAPMKLPDLYAGAPILLSAKVLAQGGELVLRGKAVDGVWEERVRIPKSAFGEGSDAVVALFGREAVEDAEMKIAAGQSKSHLDASIEALGLTYGLSTRLTSWVAIDPNASVDPRDVARRANIPQSLAHGVSAEGVGLRPAMTYASPRSSSMIGAGPGGSYGSAAPPARARFSSVARAPAPMAMPRPAPAAPPFAQAAPPAASTGRAGPEDKGHAAAKSESEADELAAPKKKAERSLLGRVKDAIFGSEEERAPAAARFVGRVVRKSGGEITIE